MKNDHKCTKFSNMWEELCWYVAERISLILLFIQYNFSIFEFLMSLFPSRYPLLIYVTPPPPPPSLSLPSLRKLGHCSLGGPFQVLLKFPPWPCLPTPHLGLMMSPWHSRGYHSQSELNICYPPHRLYPWSIRRMGVGVLSILFPSLVDSIPFMTLSSSLSCLSWSNPPPSSLHIMLLFLPPLNTFSAAPHVVPVPQKRFWYFPGIPFLFIFPLLLPVWNNWRRGINNNLVRSLTPMKNMASSSFPWWRYHHICPPRRHATSHQIYPRVTRHYYPFPLAGSFLTPLNQDNFEGG